MSIALNMAVGSERALPVVVEDDRGAGREQRVEARLVERVRVVTRSREDEQVDNVDDADAELGTKVAAEQRGGLDDLLRELEADTDKDDVRLNALVDRVVCDRGLSAMRRPKPAVAFRLTLPDHGAGDARRLGLFLGEVDGRRCLCADDQVDV